MKKIIKFSLCLGLAFSIFITGALALSKMGSRSQEVRQIQTALKERGYFNSNIDGIFGTITKKAVERFQKDNGLTVDGIAGKNTLKALGITNGDDYYSGYSSSDYELLARIISAESRGEPYLGQVAVGAVVLNRIEHPSFPDTLSGVVYQKGAFSCLDDGQFYEPIANSCYSAARDAINGLDPSGGAIYYYNPITATNKWILSRKLITTIGKHRFCE
ncbi:MAG: spore cortex-lytic enzyme [Clostridia bacterium]|nr:spore cortex-lytic enzyme [Clostridia bacterium]